MSQTGNTRDMALEMMIDIMENHVYSHYVLNRMLSLHQFMDKQERAFLTRLLQGTLERCLEIDYFLNQFSKVKTEKMKPVIRNILRISAYQILYMEQVPDHAACNEAVKLAKKKGFYGLKGFVNGILRTLSREKEHLPYPDKGDKAYLSIAYSTPEWIVDKWLERYGEEETKHMLSSQYQDYAISVRRSLKIEEEIFLQELSKECQVKKQKDLPYAYQLFGYNFLEGMKTFRKGWFQIQDSSSMFAVNAANIQKGMFVLDVCAAPGGKSLFAADLMQGTGMVLARDITKEKIEKIEENKERLGYKNIQTQCYNALDFDLEMVEKADVVIADLPCSGLGIMGHKNDIKYRTTKETIKELAKLQREILSIVWQYVRVGGVLIFSTCTITEEENEENRKWILENTKLKADSLAPYLPKRFSEISSVKEGFLQLRQGIDDTDGFFISRFIRV